MENKEKDSKSQSEHINGLPEHLQVLRRYALELCVNRTGINAVTGEVFFGPRINLIEFTSDHIRSRSEMRIYDPNKGWWKPEGFRKVWMNLSDGYYWLFLMDGELEIAMRMIQLYGNVNETAFIIWGACGGDPIHNQIIEKGE